MHTVTSRDGTTLAYDRYGAGPPVILVGGALSHRKLKPTEQLSELLSERLTVINFDRRGRGDSGDTKPFAVEREIEDIAALIEAVGGRASLWGWSSGGALALRRGRGDRGAAALRLRDAVRRRSHEQGADRGLRRPARRAGRGR